MTTGLRDRWQLALSSLALAVALTSTAAADPPAQVEVVNSPSAPVPVSVESGLLPVIVDNDASEAIPVTVQSSAPEVPILILLYEWKPTYSGDALLIEEVERVCVGVVPSCYEPNGSYVVPDDKVLVIESISVSAQISSGTPSTMAADFVITPLVYDDFYFALGRADYVYSKKKTWQTNFTGTLRAPSGSKIRSGVFWNDDVTGVSASSSISGVLIDAPGASSLASLTTSDALDSFGAARESDTSVSTSPNDTIRAASGPADFPTAR